MSLLTLDNLECERDYRVLFTQLSFQFNEGDIVQIEGPNGCGKTTLLRLITGLSTDFQGTIQWRGKPLHKVYQFALKELLFIGHACGIKKALSPRQNLRWLCGLLPVNNTCVTQSTTLSNAIDTALKTIGLHGFEDIPCYQLSAGQQQRVALARLHLSDALLWVLDEPFTALDSQGVSDLETLIGTHADRGGCVLLTAHQKLNLDNVRLLNLTNYQPDTDESK